MNRIISAGGVGIMLVGVLFAGGFIPLAVYNTFAIGTPTVSCGKAQPFAGPQNGGQNDCTVTISITNNNATEQAQIWFKVVPVVPGGGSYVAPVNTPQLITSQVGASQSFTQSLGTLSCGLYAIYDYVLSLTGVLLSPSVAVQFSPCYTLAVDNISPGFGEATVSPSQSCAGQGSAVLVCAIPPGTAVSLTGSMGATGVANGFRFECWQSVKGTPFNGCSPTNPLPLTLNQNVEVAFVGTQLNSVSVIPTTAIGGTMSPSTTQHLYELASNGQTSATFTETPYSGSTFSGWKICAVGCSDAGSSPTITLTYAQVKAIASSVGLVAIFNDASYRLTVLDSITNPGKLTLSPVPGLYPETAGQQVTVTASNVASGYTLDGFIVDGTTMSRGQTSVTVSMSGSHTVMPNVLRNAGTGCSVAGSASTTVCTTTIVCAIQSTGVANGVTTTHIDSTTVTFTSPTTLTCSSITSGNGGGVGSTTTTGGDGGKGTTVGYSLIVIGAAVTGLGTIWKRENEA